VCIRFILWARSVCCLLVPLFLLVLRFACRFKVVLGIARTTQIGGGVTVTKAQRSPCGVVVGQHNVDPPQIELSPTLIERSGANPNGFHHGCGAHGSWQSVLERGARKLAALERARERRPQQAWRGPRAHVAQACAGAAQQGRGERGSGNRRRRSSCAGQRRAGRRRAAHGSVPAGRAQAVTRSVCREVARGAGGAAVRRLQADPHGSNGAARGGRRSHRTWRSGRN
jgi:hypothetical protein